MERNLTETAQIHEKHFFVLKQFSTFFFKNKAHSNGGFLGT